MTRICFVLPPPPQFIFYNFCARASGAVKLTITGNWPLVKGGVQVGGGATWKGEVKWYIGDAVSPVTVVPVASEVPKFQFIGPCPGIARSGSQTELLPG